MNLYPYQLAALNAIREAYEAGDEIMIAAPRGYGKTSLARAFELSESVMPEFIRDDVRDAVIDALHMHRTPAPTDANEYEVEFFDLMGYSDPVTLAPLELEF